MVTKRSHTFNKSAAFSCRFVWICVTFLLPPGIKGLKRPAVGIYLLKVNNRNTRTRCEICSKLKIKTLKRRHEYLIGGWVIYVHEKVPIHQPLSNHVISRSNLSQSHWVLRFKTANLQPSKISILCCLRITKNIASGTIIYTIVKIFILHLRNLIVRKIQSIAFSQKFKDFCKYWDLGISKKNWIGWVLIWKIRFLGNIKWILLVLDTKIEVI